MKLSENQIYKWGYERKKKIRSQNDAILEENFSQNNRTEDQFSSNDFQDYNNIVNELFPIGQDMSDELTHKEEMVYNKVRDELMNKDVELQRMSEIDKLLWERIKISDVVHNVKDIANEAWMLKNITTNPTKTSPISPTKIQNSTFEEILSCSTLTPSKNKREIKFEQKQINDFPLFNDFEYESNYGNDFEESNIYELDNRQINSSMLDKEINNLYQVYDPFSLLTEN